MSWIKNFNWQEHKISLLFFFAFIISLLLLYYLFLNPLSKFFDKKAELKTFKIRYKKEQSLSVATNQRLERLEEEYSTQKKEFDKVLIEIQSKSFTTLPEVEKTIQNIADKNLVKIQTVGRIETINNSNKIYIPYIVSGMEKNLLNFIQELENYEKSISFTSTPSELLLFPQGRFTFKLATNVLNYTATPFFETDYLTIDKIKNVEIKNVKTLKFNSKTYVIINYSDGSSSIYYLGETLNIAGNNFILEIKNGDLILELKQN